jgi:RNA recognition motif-containing protein
MDNQNRLFVGNLSYQTMEADLQDHFAPAGAVLNVNLMLDKFTGRSRGFAFVEFATSEEAERAVEMFHGQDLGGRPLTVNIARPREERAPRDGGFGGGGGGGYRGGGGGGGGGYRGGGGDRRERGGGERGGGGRGGRDERGPRRDRY